LKIKEESPQSFIINSAKLKVRLTPIAYPSGTIRFWRNSASEGPPTELLTRNFCYQSRDGKSWYRDYKSWQREIYLWKREIYKWDRGSKSSYRAAKT